MPAAAAELFPSRQRTRTLGAVKYMRFAAAADAIRYAVEEIPANSFQKTFLEVNEERFDSKGIRRLYDSAEYPLPRQPTAIRDRLLSVRAGSRGAPDRALTDGEIELAVERLSPNWTRVVPRPHTGGTSYILPSLAHGRSHAVVLEIKAAVSSTFREMAITIAAVMSLRRGTRLSLKAS
jgi:hypothetical protein